MHAADLLAVGCGVFVGFTLGLIGGGWLGMKAALRLAAQRHALGRLFAALIFFVAACTVWRSVGRA